MAGQVVHDAALPEEVHLQAAIQFKLYIKRHWEVVATGGARARGGIFLAMCFFVGGGVMVPFFFLRGLI
jgi:hypothetical protein